MSIEEKENEDRIVKQAMSGKTKLVLGLAGVGAVGFLGYELVQNITGGVSNVVNQCTMEQQKLFNLWVSTLMADLKADSANGTGITAIQQSQLNTISLKLNSLQASCASEIATVSGLPAAELEIAGIISTGIAVAIALYGLSKALAVIKKSNGGKPPNGGTGNTWAEAQAYITPIIVQDLYSTGAINLTTAESMTSYGHSQLEPFLASTATAQLNYFESISIITETELVAEISLATIAIAEDITLLETIAILA